MNAQCDQSMRIIRPFKARATLRMSMVLGLVMLVFVQNSHAESSGQRFAVFIPANARVSVPANELVVNDVTNDVHEFPEQSWSLGGTSRTGIVAEFAVDQAFQYHSSSAEKRDAELSVRIIETQGQGNWTTTKITDSTSNADGNNKARVQVASTSGGSASIGLKVRMSEREQESLHGVFSTTVYCTIATP